MPGGEKREPEGFMPHEDKGTKTKGQENERHVDSRQAVTVSVWQGH